MSKSLSHLVFFACLAICSLSFGSAWRTLSGAWQGPWSLTGAAAQSNAVISEAVTSEAVTSKAVTSEVALSVAAGEALGAAPASHVAQSSPSVRLSLADADTAASMEPRQNSPAVLTASATSTSQPAPTSTLLALGFE